MASSIAFVGLVAIASSTATARPPSGVAVDDTILVGTAPLPSGPCVSTTSEAITVLVRRDLLDNLARKAGQRWQTEDERLASIAGDRAAKLNAAATGAVDRSGCAVVPPDALGDALYLVADLLERGSATVLRVDAEKAEKRVQVRYLAFRCGPHCGRGDILFSLSGTDRDTSFLSVPWWVA